MQLCWLIWSNLLKNIRCRSKEWAEFSKRPDFMAVTGFDHRLGVGCHKLEWMTSPRSLTESDTLILALPAWIWQIWSLSTLCTRGCDPHGTASVFSSFNAARLVFTSSKHDHIWPLLHSFPSLAPYYSENRDLFLIELQLSVINFLKPLNSLSLFHLHFQNV